MLNQGSRSLFEMSTPRFAHCSKGRLFTFFIFFGIVVVSGLIIYNYHLFQLELQELQRKSHNYQHRQKSLSSKLEVILDYTLSLEKSLQQVKADHRQTRRELQARVHQVQELQEKINLSSIKKCTSLHQQYRLLQSKHEVLNVECNALRVTQLQGLEERSKLESAVQAVQWELEKLYSKHEVLSVECNALRVTQLQALEERSKLESAVQAVQWELEKLHVARDKEIESLKKSLKRCQIDLNGLAELKTQNVAECPATREKSKVQSIPSRSSSPIAVIPENVNLQVLQQPSENGGSGKVRSSSANPVASNQSVTAAQDVNL